MDELLADEAIRTLGLAGWCPLPITLLLRFGLSVEMGIPVMRGSHRNVVFNCETTTEITCVRFSSFETKRLSLVPANDRARRLRSRCHCMGSSRAGGCAAL